MKNKYVALRIYNNFDWKIALQELENNNYTWASGEKPTSLYYDCTQGTIFIDIKTKTLTKFPTTSYLSLFCNYYIKVI